MPADSVPDRVEKAVGRVIRFQGPGVDRSHVPPIGVFVRKVIGKVGGNEVSFSKGDPVIGMPVSLGPNSYFASNFPVSEEDNAAGRLPEEQHSDGFQPIGNFELHVGSVLSGSSQLGPHVPGTTLMATHEIPTSDQELADSCPSVRRRRLCIRYPRSVNLKHKDLTRCSRTSSHSRTAAPPIRSNSEICEQNRSSASGIDPQRRAQVLAEHADVGLALLSRSQGFAWGNREIYRGLINDQLAISGAVPGVIDYCSRFPSLNFLCCLFQFSHR